MQNERDLVRRPCVKWIRSMQSLRQFKRYSSVYWACPPDFGKQKPQVAKKLVMDGYTKGNFDMTIVAANALEVRVWLIEFKYGKNGYTKEQKAVSDLFEDTPVQVIKIYSIDEFKKFVSDNL